MRDALCVLRIIYTSCAFLFNKKPVLCQNAYPLSTFAVPILLFHTENPEYGEFFFRILLKKLCVLCVKQKTVTKWQPTATGKPFD
jgi:hypothetical protein